MDSSFYQPKSLLQSITWFLPPFLAAYSALSACSMSSTRSILGSQMETPILTVMDTSVTLLPSLNGTEVVSMV